MWRILQFRVHEDVNLELYVICRGFASISICNKFTLISQLKLLARSHSLDLKMKSPLEAREVSTERGDRVYVNDCKMVLDWDFERQQDNNERKM